MSKNRVALDVVEPRETLAVMCPASPGVPAFRGSDESGPDYVCGGCGEVTLVEGVGEDEMYDLAFRCPSCDALSFSPRLPPGRPLPQKTVLVPPGHYRLEGTVEMREDVVMASHEAAARRLAEIGVHPTASDQSREMNEDYLRELVREAKALLGEDFDRLWARYLRGKSSATPPRDPHTLMELVDTVESSAGTFGTDQPTVNPVAVVELHLAMGEFRRWKNDPAWPSIIEPLANPPDYGHAVVTLAAASFLTEVGNAVELVRAAGSHRLPDLRLHTGARSRVNVEVKTPDALTRPSELLTRDQARRVVERALHSGSTAAGGQLADEHPGMLVIGGFGLREHDLDVLDEAATSVVNSERGKRQHIVGIAVLSFGTLLEGPSTPGKQPSLHAIVQTRVALNDEYQGAVSVDQTAQPGGLTPVEGNLQEIEGWEGSLQPNPKLGRNDPC
jgi:hypothetical protein